MRIVRQAFRFKPFSRKQKKILTWWCPDSPVKGYDGIIADGAIRSGKTVSMALGFVMWAMASFDGQNFAMCGKTIGAFRRNVLVWLKLMLKSRGYGVSESRADNLLAVSRGETVNYFYIFGGKDERSQDLIQGITLAGAFFDEVALMPESFVNQATGRCSVDGSKFWFNCNPAGPRHWFKKEWIDKSAGYLGAEKAAQLEREAEGKGEEPGLKRLLYLHFTMDDNLSLAEEVRARYRNMYRGVFFKRYILGLWAMAEGAIYDMFSEERHVVGSLDGFKWTDEAYVSCDYGTQNAAAFLLWRKSTEGIWVCAKEYYYSGRDESRQKTDSEYADDMGAFLGGIEPRAVIVDPSAASFIAELKKRGYRVRKAKNDVLDGIRFVGTLLNQGRLLFWAGCANAISEFSSYVWDGRAVERGEDRPLKQNDHAMDAVRYFCMTAIRIRQAVSIFK